MNYVNFPQLEGRGYVDSNQLAQAISTPTVLPPRLKNRINQLEKDMNLSGGTVG